MTMKSYLQTACDITYMWNLKCGTNDPMTKQKQTHRYREQTCGCQEGRSVGEGWTGNLWLVDASYYIYSG